MYINNMSYILYIIYIKKATPNQRKKLIVMEKYRYGKLEAEWKNRECHRRYGKQNNLAHLG